MAVAKLFRTSHYDLISQCFPPSFDLSCGLGKILELLIYGATSDESIFERFENFDDFRPLLDSPVASSSFRGPSRLIGPTWSTISTTEERCDTYASVCHFRLVRYIPLYRKKTSLARFSMKSVKARSAHPSHAVQLL